MSPAEWRCDNSGNVKGFVKRKGDSNPLNWGYHVDKKILDHPKIGMIKTNVAKPEKKENKCDECVKKAKEAKEEKKEKKKSEKSKSGGGCAVS
ncbi:hypothetical protein SBOR_10085 [Sclerotinia borealis F-4128]|uniref:Uncharacterized protein n=1 Tax=Sclerotinia borealis (strain F-4128) TaxID=1432307 RepID=W9C3L8_SCLBF|nr:hypothetical protein SBOR_10085 [Sclerotinia borealis F-4128]